MELNQTTELLSTAIVIATIASRVKDHNKDYIIRKSKNSVAIAKITIIS